MTACSGVDHEHTGGGDDREPLGAVAVEDMMRGAVEHPAVGVAARGDAAVDRRTRPLRVEAVARQRGELGQRRQERRRIGGPAEFLQHDRQLDGVLGVGQLRPARIDVGLPQRRRVDAVLGDAAHQRRRALLGHGVTYGLLP